MKRCVTMLALALVGLGCQTEPALKSGPTPSPTAGHVVGSSEMPDVQVVHTIPEPRRVDLVAQLGGVWGGDTEARPPTQVLLAAANDLLVATLFDAHRVIWVAATGGGELWVRASEPVDLPMEVRGCGAFVLSPDGPSPQVGAIAIRRRLGGPQELVVARAALPSEEANTTWRVMRLPEGWTLRDAGPRPCLAVVSGRRALALVPLTTPHAAGAVLFDLEQDRVEDARALPVQGMLATEPLWSTVLSDDGDRAYVAAMSRAEGGGEAVPSHHFWSIELAGQGDWVSEVTLLPLGLSDLGASAVGVRGESTGLYVATVEDLAEGRTQKSLARLSFVPMQGGSLGAPVALGPLPADAWGGAMSLSSLAGEPLLLRPVMPGQMPHLLAALVRPEDPEQPIWAAGGVDDAQVVVWRQAPPVVATAALRADAGDEDTPVSAVLELQWVGL